MMWCGGRAIYAAHLLVIVFAGSMLATTIILAANAGHLLDWPSFSSERVLKGEVWRIFTYGFVNPPSLWFVVDMFMIAWFGRELEKFFGRRTFLVFYGGLYFLSPLLFTVIGGWHPMHLAGETGAFAVFIAFATLYPNAVMLFNVLAKWVALILVGISTLIALANHDWVGLISLGATVGFAYAFVRYHQGHFTLPKLSLGRRQPQFRVLPDLQPSRAAGAKAPKEESMAEMDALLDKIAQSGLSSLTAKERAKLEKTRTNLMK